MDPFTSALQECSHRYIPYMSGEQCTTTIQCQHSRYTITITKQIDTPRYQPASILGKRHYSAVDPLWKDDPSHKEHRCNDPNLLYHPLYPDFGHNFK